MSFMEKMDNILNTLVCAPMRFVATAFSHLNKHTITVDVRIIHCLSPSLSPIMFGHVRPKYYIGVISPEFPKRCLIPESSAILISRSDLDNPNLPKLVSLSGFEQMLFYPFREFAQALKYDILWCTFKEPDSKYYTGHVLFAEHINDGVWIRVSEENAEKYFGRAYSGKLYTGGWQYASSSRNANFYVVQGIDELIYVPWQDVLETVDPA